MQLSQYLEGHKNHFYKIAHLHIIRSRSDGLYVDINALEHSLSALAEWALENRSKIAYRKFNKKLLTECTWKQCSFIFNARFQRLDHVLVLKNNGEFEEGNHYYEQGHRIPTTKWKIEEIKRVFSTNTGKNTGCENCNDSGQSWFEDTSEILHKCSKGMKRMFKLVRKRAVESAEKCVAAREKIRANDN